MKNKKLSQGFTLVSLFSLFIMIFSIASSQVKACSESIEAYNYSGSYTISAGGYFYKTVTAAGTIFDPEEIIMWVQTDDPSKYVDLYIMSNTALLNFMMDQSFIATKSAMFVNEGTLELSMPGTWVCVWSNKGRSSSVTLDYFVDVGGDDVPSYSGYTWVENGKSVASGNSYSYHASYGTDDLLSGAFKTYVSSDKIDFFICDSTDYSTWSSGGTPTTVYENHSDTSSVSWGPFRPPYTDDWYFVHSAKDSSEPVTFSAYVNREQWYPPGLSIWDPASDSSWKPGSGYSIDWTTTGTVDKVDIHLYRNDTFVSEIATGITNNDYYSWDIPSNMELSTKYQIYIFDSSDTNVNDSSEYFTISTTKTITLKSPVGGEEWEAGNTYDITWEWTGLFTSVDIDISRGQTWHSTIASGVPNTGSYSWTIPANFDYGTFWWIAVSDASGSYVEDESDYFKINSDDAPPPGNGDDGSINPTISGFNFPLEVGCYWKFKWDYTESEMQDGVWSTTLEQEGTFTVKLGSKTEIQGIPAFGVQVTGDTQRYRPRWTYVTCWAHQILGSTNGNSWQVIFDAQDGKWYGGGFFNDYESNLYANARKGTIDNDYIKADVYQTGFSTSEQTGGCTYYPGIGQICSGDTQYAGSQNYEYFKKEVGPVGLKYWVVYSYMSGMYWDQWNKEGNVGLVDYLVPEELPFVPPTTTSTPLSTASATPSTSEPISTTLDTKDKTSASNGNGSELTPGFLWPAICLVLPILSLKASKRKKNG